MRHKREAQDDGGTASSPQLSQKEEQIDKSELTGTLNVKGEFM